MPSTTATRQPPCAAISSSPPQLHLYPTNIATIIISSPPRSPPPLYCPTTVTTATMAVISNSQPKPPPPPPLDGPIWGCDRNNGNQIHGRAFMLGVEEARQDPNIMTGIEPSDLGFSYEIEIASGQLVEIEKVIKGCKLEIEGHVFDINLIPFGSGSFDMIIGMDWLSNYKAEIICHEKVVRIPLPDDKVLRVIGE
ncbi:putative reverse transcriptase domain-containing protein [Tanacetum coccineum]